MDLRARALALPGTREDIACAGTALESAAFKVKKKSFLFVGRQEVRFKLGASLAQASAHPLADVGHQGWVKCRVEALPDEIGAWIEESWALAGGRA